MGLRTLPWPSKFRIFQISEIIMMTENQIKSCFHKIIILTFILICSGLFTLFWIYTYPFEKYDMIVILFILVDILILSIIILYLIELTRYKKKLQYLITQEIMES